MRSTVIAIIAASTLVGIAVGAYIVIGPTLLNSENQQSDGNDPVARVNGEEISRADYDALATQLDNQQQLDMEGLQTESDDEIDSEVVDTLVGQELLRQAVSSAGINVSGEQLDAQLQATRSQFESDQAYQQALADENVTEEQLKSQLAQQLATQSYLSQAVDTDGITVSDEEIQSQYESLASNQSDIPPLSEIRGQLEQSLLQQKQQQLVDEHIQQLRSQADVELLY